MSFIVFLFWIGTLGYGIWGVLSGASARREGVAAISAGTITAVAAGLQALVYIIAPVGSAFAALARGVGAVSRTREAEFLGHWILSALRTIAPYVAVLIGFTVFLGTIGQGGRDIFALLAVWPFLILAYFLTAGLLPSGATVVHALLFATAELFMIALVVGTVAPRVGKWIARFGFLFILAAIAFSTARSFGP